MTAELVDGRVEPLVRDELALVAAPRQHPGARELVDECLHERRLANAGLTGQEQYAGAITALMGGTAAVHFVAGNPLFSHLLFGPYLAVFAWGGLWLRDAKLRELIPLRR